jgi:hypothetical protein
VSTLIRVIIDLVVLGALVWFVSWLPLPAPMTPLRYALYALVFVIAVVVLLPILGVAL